MYEQGCGDDALVVAVMRAGAVLHAEFARRLRRLGLSPLAVEVMRLVAAEPWASGPLIATRLRVERQSLAPVLTRLRRIGALQTEYSFIGRRVAAWALTPKGNRGLELAEAELRELERKFLGSFPEERARDLVRLLPYASAAIYRREPMTLFDYMR